MEYTQDPRLGITSASATDRTVNCPGSPNLIKQVPKEEEDNALAQEGTDIHEAFKNEDPDSLEDDPRDVYERIRALEIDQTANWFEERGFSDEEAESATKYREKRWYLKHPKTGAITNSAQLDYIILSEDRKEALIIDYKTGYLKTTRSFKNWQLRIQALVVKQAFPWLTQIRVAIAYGRPKVLFDATDYDEESLGYALRDWLYHNWRASQDDAPLVPGPWCRYCPAKAYCKPGIAYAIVDGLDLPEDQDKLPEAVKGLPVRSLVDAFKRRGIIVAYHDHIKGKLMKMPSETLKLFGLNKKKGAVVPVITDNLEARKLLLAAGFNEDELNQISKFSRKDAAELLADKAEMKKKDAQAKILELLSSVTQNRENKESLEVL